MFDLNLDRAKADAQPCAQSGNHCAQIGIFARFFNPRWPPCPQSLYSLADITPNSSDFRRKLRERTVVLILSKSC